MDHEHAAQAIRLRCEDCGGYHPAPADPAFDDLLRSSCVEVGDTTRPLYDRFHLGEPGGRWDVDREAARIRWTDSGGSVAEADYQFVGGWIEATGSFLWGWAHPHATEANTRRLAAVCVRGEAEGFPVLTTPYLIVACEDAWHLAKIAAREIGWPGVYRAKVNEDAWAFFAFSEPRWELRNTA